MNAVITGTTSGIGLEIKKELFKNGFNIFEISKNFPAIKTHQKKLDLDLASIRWNDERIISFFKKIGVIDVLINNAGIGISNKPDEYKEEDWDQTININLRAPFILSRLAIPYLKKSKVKSVINISSLSSTLGLKNNPAYHAAKSGLSGLTRSLAKDLGLMGIRVNSVAPGYVLTKLNQASISNKKMYNDRCRNSILNRWARPREIANAVLFLASNNSSFITGQEIIVDGGWSINGMVENEN
jgi:NAD(P)-dependent dehydrogenase (short-subunit alcohol dehydrogenase family)